MKFKNDIKGSVTVEAALCLPIFMAFMLLISSIARVYYTHELVQDALSDAANEIASTAYIFSITGLKGTRDDIHSSFEDKGKVAHEDFSKLLDCVDIAKSGANSLKEGNLGGMTDTDIKGQEVVSGTKDSVENIAENPIEYLKSMASVGIAFGMEKGEDAIMSLMIRQLMHKHLKAGDISAEERLVKLHVTDGIKGLSFKDSVYFDDSEDMDVVVTYTLERVDPFGLVRNVTLTNHVKTRVWMTGEVVGRGDADRDEESSEIEIEETALAETEENENDAAFKEDDKPTDNPSEVEEDEWKTRKKYLTSFGSKFYHTNPKCGHNMDNATLYEGKFLDLPGGKNDQFEYNGKIYSYCTRCDDGLFNE